MLASEGTFSPTIFISSGDSVYGLAVSLLYFTVTVLSESSAKVYPAGRSSSVKVMVCDPPT